MEQINLYEGLKNYTENEIDYCPIDKLNPDCLARIFQFLPRIHDRLTVEQVCSKWNEASKLSWNDIKTLDSFDDNLYCNNCFLEQAHFEKILKRCGIYLTKLIIIPNGHFDSSIMPIIGKYCLDLTDIELWLRHYCDNDFIDAFKNMKKLKTIKISGYTLSNKTTTLNDDDNGIDSKILNCVNENLENLAFESFHCDKFMPKSIAKAIIKFNNLRSLELKNWQFDNNLMDIISKKITLTRLSIYYSNFSCENFLISRLINLEYLTLYDVNLYENSLNDDTLITIINNCKRIKYLNITKCNNISKVALKKIKFMENLEELILNYTKIDDNVIRNYRNLKIFECENCKKITDKGVKKLIKKSPNIQRLSLSGTSVTDEIIKFSATITKRSKKKLCLIINYDIINNFNDINCIRPFLRLEDDCEFNYWE